MDCFPQELLHNVFIQLDLQERLVCALVCRSWWSVLDRYSLFYNVEIDNTDRFDRFMEMIAQSPHRATQIQELTLYGRFEKDFNKRTLCNMFHNLRYIKMKYWGTRHHFSEPIEVTQTTSKIRSIYDREYCEYTLQVVNSNLCLQLETLELQFGTHFLPYPTIVRQLKNMPVLKNLTLCYAELSVADMEILHGNVPSIQALDLSDMRILDSEMPVNIIPPTFLTEVSFNIAEMGISDFYPKWYLYASKKYINVEKWCYFDENLGDLGENADHFYSNGFIQFLELVGPTTPKLTLYHIPASIDVFQALDNAGAQIEDFEFKLCQGDRELQNLAKSSQSAFVKQIFFMDAFFDSFPHIRNLTSLTTLTLENIYRDAVYDEINLTDCLNALPDTLKTLSVYTEEVKVNSVDCKLSSIQYLTIGCDTLTKDLADIISTCFPKLIEVDLRVGVDYDVKLSLPSQFLKSATLSLPSFEYSAFVFSFKCPGQDEPVFYLIDAKNKTDVRVTNEEAKAKPILSVVSHTKKSLKFIPQTSSVTDIVMTS